jgi:hypothetical protein
MSETVPGLVPGAFKGRKHTAATLAKMRERAKANGAGDRLRKMAADRVGKPMSAETRQRISDARSNGKRSQITNLRQAAGLIGVEPGVMAALHADLALLAKQYSIPLATLQRITASRFLHRVEVVATLGIEPKRPKGRAAPVSLTPRAGQPAAAKPLEDLFRVRCIACGEVFQQTPKCRIKCEPCSGRRYA